MSIAFTAVVLAIFAALWLGKQPAEWVYFLPLIPLALLTLSGLDMFALPHVAMRRSGRGAAGSA